MTDLATRDAFGAALVALGRTHPNMFVIDCDIGKSMKTGDFAAQFPERHINVGIAEQNAAGIAAGLAACGKIPVISTYAVFGSMRMLEQVRTSICYPGLHVVLACGHGGLTPSNDGVTHQAIEDMGIYRTIPNMSVLMPADYASTLRLMGKAVDAPGPVYIRFTRDAFPIYYDEKESFEIGKAKIIKKGSALTLISCGELLRETLRAAEVLESKFGSIGIVDMHTIKPLDIACVKECLKMSPNIVTVEDHSIINGLGSAVAEVIANEGYGKLRCIGLRDTFAESGRYAQLLEKYSMNENAIIKAAEELMV